MLPGIAGIAGFNSSAAGASSPYGSHAYWRLFVTNTNGGTVVNVGELNFKDASGSTIPATGGTASASSNDGNAPASAFDGSLSSIWRATSGANEWLRYQFAAPVAVAQIVLYTPTSGTDFINRAPKDCKLQYSDDGSTWSDAFSFTNYLPVSGYGETYPFVAPPSGYHRAWRVFCVNNNGDAIIRIEELEFRATAGGADQTSTTATDGRAISSSGTASGAFDNTTSQWNSATNTNEWVGFVFAAAVKNEEITVKSGSVSAATRSPKDMLFQYSDDGVTWTTQKTFASQTGWSASETRTLTAI